jgi:hypothetical protein
METPTLRLSGGSFRDAAAETPAAASAATTAEKRCSITADDRQQVEEQPIEESTDRRICQLGRLVRTRASRRRFGEPTGLR